MGARGRGRNVQGAIFAVRAGVTVYMGLMLGGRGNRPSADLNAPVMRDSNSTTVEVSTYVHTH